MDSSVVFKQKRGKHLALFRVFLRHTREMYGDFGMLARADHGSFVSACSAGAVFLQTLF